MLTSPLLEYRCTCGRLLFKGVVRIAPIQIKCRRCGCVQTFGSAEGGEDRRYGFMVNGAGRITAVSETAPAILGYTAEELYGMDAGQLHAYVPSAPRRCPSRTSLMAHETHRTKSNGMLSVRVQREPVGGEELAELHLCEVYVPRKEVVQDAPEDGIRVHDLAAAIDTRGRCTYASEQLTRFLGTADAVLLGTDLLEFLRDNDARRFRSRSGPAHAWVPFTLEDVRFRHDDSQAFTLCAVPAIRDDGTLRGHMLVFDTYAPAGA